MKEWRPHSLLAAGVSRFKVLDFLKIASVLEGQPRSIREEDQNLRSKAAIAQFEKSRA